MTSHHLQTNSTSSLPASAAQGAQQFARARRIGRLRNAVELAEDPSDIFDATADLCAALVRSHSEGATSARSSAAPASGGGGAGYGTPAASYAPAASSSLTAVCDDAASPYLPSAGGGGVQQSREEQLQLALTLHAALSEPVLRHNGAGGAGTTTTSSATTSPCMQTYSAAMDAGAPAFASSCSPLTAVSTASLPAASADWECHTDCSLATAAPKYELPISSGAGSLSAGAAGATGARTGKQPRLLQQQQATSLQLPEALRRRLELELQRRQQQKQQQLAQLQESQQQKQQSNHPLYQLLCAELQVAQGDNNANVQQQAISALQQQQLLTKEQRRQMLLQHLLQQQQLAQQLAQQRQAEMQLRKAQLLDRLKQAIASSARPSDMSV